MLRVTAAACAAPLLPGRAFADRNGDMPAFEWRGTALGLPGRITIRHPEAHRARAVASHCVRELRRLERIFSLYESGSELSRLNRAGRLDRASLDLRFLLTEAQRLGQLTEGAFDVTVQPLWRLYAGHFGTPGADPHGPPRKQIAAARHRIDFRRIDVSGASAGFLAPGMSVTMNGIAQGYIDDRIGEILRNEGFDQALVDLGEIRSLAAGGGAPGWRVGIAFPGRNGGTAAEIVLADGALATSSGSATTFDAGGRHHHLFDPATGVSATRHRQVSVVSPRATLSDALATALAVLPADRAAEILAKTGAERALIIPHSGPPAWVSTA